MTSALSRPGLVLLGLCAGAWFGQPAAAQSLQFIDTHTHLDQQNGIGAFPAALKSAEAQMAERGIAFTILLPSPQSPNNRLHYDIEELAPVAKQDPQKFGFLGGGGSLNIMVQSIPPDEVTEAVKRKFRARAEAILAAGALGFGEMAIEHFSLPQMGPRHPYEAVPADHPLLLLLADIAAEHDVPIDVHFDVSAEDRPLPQQLHSPPNPPSLKENLAAFERLLAHNPKARIFWAHAGADPGHERSVELCRKLLTAHPNLYMSLRTGPRGPGPILPIAEDGSLKKNWLKLIHDFPDRFTLGSDQFYTDPANRRRTATMGLDTLRDLLNGLPPALAQQVAVTNAKRLYHLAN